MIFVASMLEPYLTETGVAWRSPMPIVIVADDEREAIESLKRKFSVRVPEIEQRLSAQYPAWNKDHYREVTLAPLPEKFVGAESLFLMIANARKPTRFHM